MRSFGRKVVFMAEWTSSGKNVFDLDQLTFCFTDAKGKRRTHWVGDVYLKKNIVDMVRSGEELRAWDDMEREPGTKRFYTYMLSCHDSDHYIVKGSPITIGYQAIFAPFIPLWYVGEEWDSSAFLRGLLLQAGQAPGPEEVAALRQRDRLGCRRRRTAISSSS